MGALRVRPAAAQPVKGRLSQRLTVSLKRYPDTKREFSANCTAVEDLVLGGMGAGAMEKGCGRRSAPFSCCYFYCINSQGGIRTEIRDLFSYVIHGVMGRIGEIG